ncbi:peptide methionine sulfoxide reductase [Toxoplasma gondii ME49]|uniref:peptide-methionine (S)-S-oxide reductase n=12 Tax=Toxoplasma gondii TaxID=5811 RepID=B9PMF9_TOXGV|nr:peptide methionine sulfoxide reductase [Toxoplasma gondii ME49]EPR62143.1 peptide methionine sulfoxide reductase [Toxoplasma gondii GT1]ESS32536.1 peptide methionine sulfoxide reductase [Toxoplasma gondii VEG]KAF4640594.1 peptide methionine sulfoxide reductase [Toxoplasma gondii]KFG45523.1 peptide methionine sulfoxide reductase [Toxoplasma gondii GAB2-2007-GAL-DOM2]KFG55142.1 peptide methionine sulfoxide reductase [Toxoplasma gondii FOU]KFG60823.1 peptide methionine sulfoxide reductase [To|eukprot:XP_002366220.1 peptide methionine sulfoxide reductase [Toxoplasma gondii ME49]
MRLPIIRGGVAANFFRRSQPERFRTPSPLILLGFSGLTLSFSGFRSVPSTTQSTPYQWVDSSLQMSRLSPPASCASTSAGDDRGTQLEQHTPNFLPGTDRTAPFSRVLLGAGCFWGVEKLFRKEFGSQLRATTVGYAGGAKDHPTYKEVCTGNTGHYEVVEIQFFEDKVTLSDLLRFFWRIHDPTTLNRQGNDVGQQYGSAIFVYSAEHRQTAEELRDEMQKQWAGQITTRILGGKLSDSCFKFWKAEDYHQVYLERNPGGYCNHRVRF